MIIQADCLEEMKKMADNYINCIVTDPPYGLGFMGKKWDTLLPHNDIWKEALRIIKPGGHLLAFGGTRTYHRLTCAIEDSGWEIRDCLLWIYGSGFPKSHNHFGIEGYGTALKPAYEPIIFASKPYEISHLLSIILLDLTNEVYKCQKLNYNVSDAEENLSDSLVLLDRAQKHIVQDDAKIYAWERLSSVEYVAKNVMSLSQELSEKINREKEFFAHINAKESGSEEDTTVKKILLGEAESLFVAIQDIVIFALKENTRQNIVWLWKLILAGIYQGMSKYTTKMVINLITELRILKSCLSPSISNDIGNFSPDYQPIIMAMKPLDGTFKQNAEKWGQAGINIDGCRIGTDDTRSPTYNMTSKGHKGGAYGSKDVDYSRNGNLAGSEKGRWPANVILDEEAAKMLDEQSGFSKSPSGIIKGCSVSGGILGKRNGYHYQQGHNDSGGASRFFKCIDNYIAKGRWPANVMFDEEAAAMLDEQSGMLKSGKPGIRRKIHHTNCMAGNLNKTGQLEQGHGDSGGASRFFKCIDNYCSLCYNPCTKVEEKECKNTYARSAKQNLKIIQETNPNSAQENANLMPKERFVQNVKCAGNLCDLCATNIVRVLVEIKTSDFKKEELQVTLDYIGNYKSFILLQNLVFFADLWENIDIIPTIKSLYILFGSVHHAIENYTKQENQEMNGRKEQSRFLYCPKASSSERNEGLEGFKEKQQTTYGEMKGTPEDGANRKSLVKNHHPTVKPLRLMEYLIKLVMPPKNGILLDPFAGSGTTILAAKNMGVSAIGIEKNEEYCEIARKRCNS